MLIKTGDILDITEGMIVHQVNCLGIMGGGLALSIRNRYPEVYKSYKTFCDSGYQKLGTVLVSNIDSNENLLVANLFGQEGVGGGVRTDYKALEKGLTEIARFARSTGEQVFLPYKLGCGLAGGDWTVVSEIIDRVIPEAVVIQREEDK